MTRGADQQAYDIAQVIGMAIDGLREVQLPFDEATKLNALLACAQGSAQHLCDVLEREQSAQRSGAQLAA